MSRVKHDITQVWPLLVDYFYRDSLTISEHNVCALLALSRQLLVASVDQYCLDFLQVCVCVCACVCGCVCGVCMCVCVCENVTLRQSLRVATWGGGAQGTQRHARAHTRHVTHTHTHRRATWTLATASTTCARLCAST
jgi:Na+/citrate or Na+/malate symporter